MEKIVDMIAIDPGFHSGVAAFLTGCDKPAAVGMLRAPNKKDPLWDRVEFLLVQMDVLMSGLIEQFDISSKCRVLIEYPAFFSGSGGRMTAARGDLVKLAFITGALAAHISGLQLTIVPVEVSAWKGQLSKKHVNERIKKLIQMEFADHIADAVGIGLWDRGVF